jgi:gliding motility-associated-like protein
MKHLLLLFLFPLFVYSQYCPALGPDQFLPCGVGTTTLTADLSQCGPGGPNPNQTTNYNVTNIPYVNQTNTGTQLFMTDDSQQGPFNIGFTFCFFGQTYTQFYIGSNGWISFSPGQPTTFTTQTIPTGNALVPRNCIMSPWQDWNPALGGQIRYQTVGVAPCRKLIVSWIGIPMYSCTSNQGTFHIVINESTNIIDSYIQNKPACLSWQNGTATQGIHNVAGTIGIAVPGRNSSAWVTNNNAWRWTPSGPVVNPVLTWYQVGNPNPIGTGPSINVTPPAVGASYTCKFVYPVCNAGWATCNAIAGLGPDTVFVQPGPPNLPPPTVVITNPTCNSYCDGSLVVTPNGGTGVQTISWLGNQNGFNPTGLCAGNYTMTLVDGAGCDVTSTVTLVEPPLITINSITGSDTVCYNSILNQYNVSSVFPNLNYIWNTTIGSITTGQGTNQINLDVTGVNGGNYVNALTIIGVDQIGCQSSPQTFNIVDLNVLPVITNVGPFCEYDNCITLNATPSGGVFSGLNVWLDEYCPNNGFIGVDSVGYEYIQSGCMFDTSLYVQVFPRPLPIPVTNGLVGEDDEYHEICDGDSIVDVFDLQSLVQGLNQWYVFGDTISNQILSLTWQSQGIYTFQGVRWENGCVSNPQSFTVTIDQCPSELIYIPTAFTPNGDERNNTFKPIITSGVDIFNYSFVIYNRWGQIIWESFNPLSGWDGTYNNIPCQDGTYTWKLRFKVINTDEIKEYMGNLTLIR